MSEPFWRGAAEDEAMQDEHGFLWRAILNVGLGCGAGRVTRHLLASITG